MDRPYRFGPSLFAFLTLLVLPVPTVGAQQTVSANRIARPVEQAPLHMEEGISAGLHGLVRGGTSAFLRSAGDKHIGALDYSFAAGLLYQFSPSFGIVLEQHLAAFPAANLDYNATILGLQFGLASRRVTPTLALGARSAWGHDIDQFGIWIGIGLDWKVNRKLSVAPLLGTGPVDAGSGIAGLSSLGAGVRVQLYDSRRYALVDAVSYPDTLWRNEPAVFSASLDSAATLPARIQWKFSDGKIVDGDSVGHAFPRPGPHRIEVTTFNSAGRSRAELIVEVFDRRLEAEKRRNKRLAAGDDDRAPLNARIIGTRELLVGEFENYRARIDPKTRRPLRYEWKLGDGTSADGNNVVHAYERPGQYVVTVRISNDFGEATYETLINVQAPPAPPQTFIPKQIPPAPPADQTEETSAGPFSRSSLYSSAGIDWDGGGFSILTATRLDRMSAEAIALEHYRAGYRTGIRVDDNADSGAPVYRIILGQFATLPEATAALQALKSAGHHGFIVDVK